MKKSNDKTYYRDMVSKVRDKLTLLPESSHIRSALSTDKLKEIFNRIEHNNIKDLEYGYWPPLFLFLYHHSVSGIQAFESDIELVIRHSNKTATQIPQFLKASAEEDRLWVGRLFEIFVKARCLKEKGAAVELDYTLPNRRETDIRLEIRGKAYYLECTVITDSDEDREVWDRFMTEKKIDSDATLVRPGKYDSPNSKSPSSYYDCLRFYDKVYDKLTKNLDPGRSQMSYENPNLLLVSFDSSTTSSTAESPGIGWALDELFADQPKSEVRLRDKPSNIADISFLEWLDFKAKVLNQNSHLDLKMYYANFDDIVAAPRKLGGILLFDRCLLKASRVNYNADVPCRVSHHEIAGFEKLLEIPPNYCSD